MARGDHELRLPRDVLVFGDGFHEISLNTYIQRCKGRRRERELIANTDYTIYTMDRSMILRRTLKGSCEKHSCGRFVI